MPHTAPLTFLKSCDHLSPPIANLYFWIYCLYQCYHWNWRKVPFTHWALVLPGMLHIPTKNMFDFPNPRSPLVTPCLKSRWKPDVLSLYGVTDQSYAFQNTDSSHHNTICFWGFCIQCFVKHCFLDKSFSRSAEQSWDLWVFSSALWKECLSDMLWLVACKLFWPHTHSCVCVSEQK